MNKSKLFFEVLRLPIDILAVFSALLLAYKIRPITDLIPGVQYAFFPEYLPPYPVYLQFSVLASVFLVLLFTFNGLYSIKFTEGIGKTILKIIYLVSVWLMFIIAYYFLILHELFFSRIALVQIWGFSIFFLILGRCVIRWIQNGMHRLGMGRIRLLFIGVNTAANRAYQALKNDRKYEIIGALSEKVESHRHSELKIIGSFSELGLISKKYAVHEIIQAEPAERISPEKMLAFCRSEQIHYYFIPEVLQLQTVNISMEMIDGLPLVSLKQTRLEGWGWIYKRLFDFFASLILIILLTPLWIIIPILIKLDSPGPVFYVSQRKFKDKIFGLIKFRSMVVNAEAQKKTLLEQNERKGPLFKIKNDPRVTKLGKFLRKTSIDELPQLFNVLQGSLSLVGPRPHLPEEVAQYEAHHLGVFVVKPGITGLAQINGRSNLDFEDEIKLDFYYIENWSFWLDIKILLRTVGVVFRADGH